MRLSKAWIIASKDFQVFLRKKTVLYTLVLFPLFVSIGLPLIIHFIGAKTGGIPKYYLPTLLDAFAFFFVVGATTLPTVIASYSMVGEKVEKSLEPLLATPTTDGEILMGKSIASFVPPLLAIYISSIIFMALMDYFTFPTLGYLYFPNWNMALVLLLVCPLAAILSVEANIMISSRSNDVRSASQLGGLVVLPFGALYVFSEVGIVNLDAVTLLLICAVLVLIDIALFFVSTAIFQREKILTEWK